MFDKWNLKAILQASKIPFRYNLQRINDFFLLKSLLKFYIAAVTSQAQVFQHKNNKMLCKKLIVLEVK